jgi:hypothetical protein
MGSGGVMRRIRQLLGLSLLAGLGLGGCTWSPKEVRPPPPPEEFKAPPETDPRYGNPQEYPKDTLDQDDPVKKAKDSLKMPGQMGGGSKGTGRGF